MINIPSYPQSYDWSSQTSKVPLSGQNMEYIDTVCAALSQKQLVTSGDIPATPSSSNIGSVAFCASSSSGSETLYSMSWCGVPTAANQVLYWTGTTVSWSAIPTYSGGWSTS